MIKRWFKKIKQKKRKIKLLDLAQTIELKKLQHKQELEMLELELEIFKEMQK